MSQDVLELKNEELQQKNSDLRNNVAELEAEIASRPTLEDMTALQREHAELQEQRDSVDLDALANLAKQGEAYLELLRDDAKAAFKAKLMEDGVHKYDVETHPEYISHCNDVDEVEDIEMLQRSAKSDYTLAKSDHAWRVSASLSSLKTKNTPPVRFSRAGGLR